MSLGVASHQLLVADALRQRLPRVAEVFAAGAINYRMVAAVVSRTRLINDPDALAKVDTEIAAHVSCVGVVVGGQDPARDRLLGRPLRPRRGAAHRRPVRVAAMSMCRTPDDGSGTADIEARLLATDAEALDQRLDAMAAAVCDDDPRTLDQRRADALGAIRPRRRPAGLPVREPRLPGRRDAQPSTVVVHVIAHEESLTDDTPAQFDGEEEPAPTAAQAAAAR